MIEIKNCQICNGNNFLRITKTKDYSTSNEEFVIVKSVLLELVQFPKVSEQLMSQVCAPSDSSDFSIVCGPSKSLAS